MCTEQYTHFYCIDCRTCIRKAYEWEICEEALKSESKSMGSCGYTCDGEVAIASEYCQQCPPDERKWGKINLCGGLGSEAWNIGIYDMTSCETNLHHKHCYGGSKNSTGRVHLKSYCVTAILLHNWRWSRRLWNPFNQTHGVKIIAPSPDARNQTICYSNARQIIWTELWSEYVPLSLPTINHQIFPISYSLHSYHY